MLVRRSVALALSAALAVTGLAATAPTAGAATADPTPYEVTIPAPASASEGPSMDLVAVGTGAQMVRGYEAYLPNWQSLRGGPVAHGTGCWTDDWFAYGDRRGCVSWGYLTVHDFAAGTDVVRFLDGERPWYPLVSRDRLLAAEAGADGMVLHLIGHGPGAPADLDVTLPGVTERPSLLAYDDTTALLAHRDATGWHTNLLDLATGALTPVPELPFATGYRKAVLGTDWIVQYDTGGTGRAFVVSRTRPGDPGRVVTLPENADDTDRQLAVAGDWLVGHSAAGDGSTPPTLLATPLDGGASRDLGVTGYGDFQTGPDGAPHLMGSADGTHWGVLRLAPGADGAPVASQVLAVPPTVPYTAVTMSHGRVVTETQTDTHTLRGTDVSLTGPRTATPTWTCDALTAVTPNCPSLKASFSSSASAWWHDTGDGRLVVLENTHRPASGSTAACYRCAVAARVTTPGAVGTTRTVLLSYPGLLQAASVIAVSGRLVYFRGDTAAGRRLIVADIETGRILRVSPAEANQALWGTQLWTASTTDDTVTAVDVRTGATVETVDLGTNCAVDELQVVARWILARCDGNAGAVYDRGDKTLTKAWIPRGARPRLGDGFLAYADYGLHGDYVAVTDFRTGERDRYLGELAREPGTEDEDWSVDRFTGSVAFVDSWRAVHVVGLGGVTSPLAVLDADAPAASLKAGPWKPRWWLSKPAGSWSLVLRHKVSGKTVRTLTGGQARGAVAPVWDGKDAAGRYVPNGAYTWSLTVRPADGHGADLALSGAVAVSGGAAVWRDMAGDDGFGDLLAMDTAGAVSLYRGTGTGGVSARIPGAGAAFPAATVFVPVGDLSGDRCPDVYARVGDQLRAYRPGCGRPVTASSPYTLVGAGWSPYDVLTSPGDVNGDGHADLITRQASTGDVYFYAGTADHRLKARVRIGTNWKLYKKIVGAGDLNGDGRGDLLGVDASGVLWRYHSTATGTVSARVKVGGGWQVYTSLVGVGDLSGDGRVDLLARDTAGKLWRYSSTGTGAYGARVLVGSGGWNGFKGLF